MRSRIIFFLTGMSFIMAAPAVAQESSVNQLKTEMRLMNDAYINLIQAVVLNIPEAIEDSFHQVYQEREEANKALKDGVIELPKNKDKMKEFSRMEAQLYERIGQVMAAAKKKDMKTVRLLTGKLIENCTGCHDKFKE